jgi:holo-[acyl-carrier protein] synthase
MIAGIGIDAASIAQTAGLIDRFADRFTRRVFTEIEREYCQARLRPAQSYAARFAAKEAVMKVLASGWGSGVRFHDIELAVSDRGAPRIVLSGGARLRAEQLGINRVHVSLSHQGDLALAVAVAES